MGSVDFLRLTVFCDLYLLSLSRPVDGVWDLWIFKCGWLLMHDFNWPLFLSPPSLNIPSLPPSDKPTYIKHLPYILCPIFFISCISFLCFFLLYFFLPKPIFLLVLKKTTFSLFILLSPLHLHCATIPSYHHTITGHCSSVSPSPSPTPSPLQTHQLHAPVLVTTRWRPKRSATWGNPSPVSSQTEGVLTGK